LRAAYRLIELCMPVLEAGKSLRFVMMPEGQDPDDLIKAKGKAGMQDVLDGAMPMVALLWRRETEGKTFDSPERRAMLDKSLRTVIGPIKDPSIKKHYGQILNDMRFDLFRSGRDSGPKSGSAGKRTSWKKGSFSAPTDTVKASALVQAGQEQTDHMRMAVILGTLIRNPSTIEQFVIQLEGLHPASSEHAALLDALLVHGFGVDAEELYDVLAQKCGLDTLDRLFAHPHVQITPPVRKPDTDVAAMCLTEELAKWKALSGHRAEIHESVEAMFAAEDERVTHRLKSAAEARNKAIKAEAEDRTTFDVAENGLEVSRDERESFRTLLDKLAGDGKGGQ